MAEQVSYIPALNFSALTPVYDWIVKTILPEQAFKAALLREAELNGGERVLDVGCGTGTLALELARACPRGEVVGIDADDAILSRARAKADDAGLRIRLERAMSIALPFPDAAFDRVTSTLMLHHLAGEDKARTFREMHRVLRPGGKVHIGDFGEPEGAFAKLFAHVAIHFEHTRENIHGDIPRMLIEAGFEQVREGQHFGVLGGTLRILHATKRR